MLSGFSAGFLALSGSRRLAGLQKLQSSIPTAELANQG